MTLATAGARLAVRQSRPDGEPVILLHGGPGVPDRMQSSIAPLLDGFRCISFDQRGVGGSVCLDGRFDPDAYLGDIEAVRACFGLDRVNLLGHSWGGLLAQAYTARHPERVERLLLSSSSLGFGDDWKRTKREAFATDRRRAGPGGTLRFLAYGSLLYLPGPLPRWAMPRVMTETWRNYAFDRTDVTDPEPGWLAGCSATAMLATDRAAARQPAATLDPLRRFPRPVLVLYGEHDIFGDATGVVRRRFPHGRQVALPGSGHLHWLDNPGAYRADLRSFLSIDAVGRDDADDRD